MYITPLDAVLLIKVQWVILKLNEPLPLLYTALPLLLLSPLFLNVQLFIRLATSLKSRTLGWKSFMKSRNLARNPEIYEEILKSLKSEILKIGADLHIFSVSVATCKAATLSAHAHNVASFVVQPCQSPMWPRKAEGNSYLLLLVESKSV